MTTGSFFGLQGPQVERCKPEKAAFRAAFSWWCCEFVGKDTRHAEFVLTGNSPLTETVERGP
jgi:hypothetical protein